MDFWPNCSQIRSTTEEKYNYIKSKIKLVQSGAGIERKKFILSFVLLFLPVLFWKQEFDLSSNADSCQELIQINSQYFKVFASSCNGIDTHLEDAEDEGTAAAASDGPVQKLITLFPSYIM